MLHLHSLTTSNAPNDGSYRGIYVAIPCNNCSGMNNMTILLGMAATAKVRFVVPNRVDG